MATTAAVHPGRVRLAGLREDVSYRIEPIELSASALVRVAGRAALPTLNFDACSLSAATSLERLRAAAEVSSTIAAFCWVDWSIDPIAALIWVIAVDWAWLSVAIWLRSSWAQLTM